MLADYDAAGIADVMGLGDVALSDARYPGLREENLPMKKGRRGTSFAAPSISYEISPVAIEQAVARGLPREVLRHLAERIVGDDTSKIASLEWSVVPKTTLERRAEHLSPAESERTERVARLFVHAWRALGSEEEARSFMVAPHPELDGRSPVEAARTDLAARRVERLLNALEYGLAI